MGFSLRWLLFLWNVASRAPGLRQWQQVGSGVVVPGLWSAGLVFVGHRLNCSVSRGILPDQGSNVCLLHGRQILTTEPPGKPQGVLLGRKECLKLPQPDFPCLPGVDALPPLSLWSSQEDPDVGCSMAPPQMPLEAEKSS